jgi:acyl carrier protein
MPNLTPDGVLADLQPIFQEALENPALVVTRSSSAQNTPNWDSLRHIEIIDMVERRFKVRFDLGEVQDMKTVGDLVDLTIKEAQH